jgi:hypothetical protein
VACRARRMTKDRGRSGRQGNLLKRRHHEVAVLSEVRSRATSNGQGTCKEGSMPPAHVVHHLLALATANNSIQ